MVRISFEKERKMKEFFKNLKDLFNALTKFQFMRFCVTGTLGVVTDMIVSYIVYLLIGVDPKAEKTFVSQILLCLPPVLGFIAAVTQNYLLNHLWTFGKETENHRVSFILYGKFFVVCCFALIPRLLFYYFLLTFVFHNGDSSFNLANFGGIIAGMFINFFGSKFFVFRFRDEAPKRIEEAPKEIKEEPKEEK